MKRSRQSSKLDKYLACCEAEDRAVAYLGIFPAQIAHAIALRVERVFAMRWNEEQSGMIRRDDHREVVSITHDELQELETALAAIPPGLGSDAAAERHIIDLLADFPPDRAWWIVNKIVKYEAVRAQLCQTKFSWAPIASKL